MSNCLNNPFTIQHMIEIDRRAQRAAHQAEVDAASRIAADCPATITAIAVRGLEGQRHHLSVDAAKLLCHGWEAPFGIERRIKALQEIAIALGEAFPEIKLSRRYSSGQSRRRWSEAVNRAQSILMR